MQDAQPVPAVDTGEVAAYSKPASDVSPLAQHYMKELADPYVLNSVTQHKSAALRSLEELSTVLQAEQQRLTRDQSAARIAQLDAWPDSTDSLVHVRRALYPSDEVGLYAPRSDDAAAGVGATAAGTAGAKAAQAVEVGRQLRYAVLDGKQQLAAPTPSVQGSVLSDNWLDRAGSRAGWGIGSVASTYASTDTAIVEARRAGQIPALLRELAVSHSSQLGDSWVGLLAAASPLWARVVAGGVRAAAWTDSAGHNGWPDDLDGGDAVLPDEEVWTRNAVVVPYTLYVPANRLHVALQSDPLLWSAHIQPVLPLPPDGDGQRTGVQYASQDLYRRQLVNCCPFIAPLYSPSLLGCIWTGTLPYWPHQDPDRLAPMTSGGSSLEEQGIPQTYMLRQQRVTGRLVTCAAQWAGWEEAYQAEQLWADATDDADPPGRRVWLLKQDPLQSAQRPCTAIDLQHCAACNRDKTTLLFDSLAAVEGFLQQVWSSSDQRFSCSERYTMLLNSRSTRTGPKPAVGAVVPAYGLTFVLQRFVHSPVSSN